MWLCSLGPLMVFGGIVDVFYPQQFLYLKKKKKVFEEKKWL